MVRGKVLPTAKKDQGARKALIMSLVEDAMLLGLDNPRDIYDWLGGDSTIQLATLRKYQKAIREQWIENSINPDQLAQQERVRLIKAARKIESECAARAETETDNTVFTRLKKLQLEAQARVAKLADVERLSDDATSPLSINLFGKSASEEEVENTIETIDSKKK